MSSSPMPDVAGGDSVSSRATATTAETGTGAPSTPGSLECPPPLSRQQSGNTSNSKLSADNTGDQMLKRTQREKFETGRAHRASALPFHQISNSHVGQTRFRVVGQRLMCGCDDGTAWNYTVICALKQ